MTEGQKEASPSPNSVTPAERILAPDPFNAFVSRIGEDRPARSEGPLQGVLLAVKDNLLTPDFPTTAGTRLLHDWVPPFEATAVLRSRAAGALVVGKTNLDAFGMGSTGEASAFGATSNPIAPDRVPGGSSSGSAAAVAGGLADLALGSDTGGSVRLPAAFCGLFGLRPTWGRVSRHGLVAFASSMDVVGLMARDLDLLQTGFFALEGRDPLDPTSFDAQVHRLCQPAWPGSPSGARPCPRGSGSGPGPSWRRFPR
ncbi:MAG: amidase family protein [Myxococcota bacterium]